MNDNGLVQETRITDAPSSKADYIKAIISFLIDIPHEEYLKRIYFLSDYLWRKR